MSLRGISDKRILLVLDEVTKLAVTNVWLELRVSALCHDTTHVKLYLY